MKPKKEKKPAASAPSLTSPGPAIEDQEKKQPLERERERQEQSVADVLAAADVDGGRIVLRRRTLTDTEFGFLAEIPVKGFSEALVANVFGGGEYKAQVKVGTTFAGNFAFKIDFSIPSKYPGAKTEEKKESSDVAAILQALPGLIAGAAPKADGGMAMMMPLIIAMMDAQSKQMIAMITNRPTGPDPAVQALTAVIADLKSDMKALASQKGGDGFEGFLNKFGKFQELIAELGVGGGGGGDATAAKPDRVAQLLEAFGPSANLLAQKLLNLTDQTQPQPIQQVQATPQPALPAPIVTPPAAPIAPGKPAAPATTGDKAPPSMKNPLLAGYVSQFRSWAMIAAKRQRDPMEWVEDKFAELPKLAHQTVFDLANKETWFKDVFGPDPDAMEHVTWLTEMRTYVLCEWFKREVKKASAATPRLEPEPVAKALADAASLSFHQEIFNRSSPEAWADFLGDLEIDQVWLEGLRVAMEHEVDSDGDDDQDETKPDGDQPPGDKPADAPKSPRKPKPTPDAKANANAS